MTISFVPRWVNQLRWGLCAWPAVSTANECRWCPRPTLERPECGRGLRMLVAEEDQPHTPIAAHAVGAPSSIGGEARIPGIRPTLAHAQRRRVAPCDAASCSDGGGSAAARDDCRHPVGGLE